MTIKECYAAFDGNYDEVLSRLMREQTVQKFLFKFLDDKSYGLLIAAMDSGNSEEAFRAAHTIKGVCQNLAFTRLYKSSDAITEILRTGNLDEARAFLPTVAGDYQETVQAIQTLKATVEGTAQ